VAAFIWLTHPNWSVSKHRPLMHFKVESWLFQKNILPLSQTNRLTNFEWCIQPYFGPYISFWNEYRLILLHFWGLFYVLWPQRLVLDFHLLLLQTFLSQSFSFSSVFSKRRIKKKFCLNWKKRMILQTIGIEHFSFPDPPELSNSLKSATDDIIDSLVCPPPPSDNIINEDIISSLIVPAPGWSKF